MSEKSLFPRRSEIFKGDMKDIRDSVARPSLDTFYQVNFSFGNYNKWLGTDGVNNMPRYESLPAKRRSQGRDFMRKMSLLCTEAEIPGTSFQTSLAVGHHQGIQEEFPNLRTFPPLNLTFYVDADQVITEVFEKWMSYINPIFTNKRQLNAYSRFNYPEDYKEIIHLTKFERDTFIDNPESDYKSDLTSYEFVNVWPTNLTSMRVAYGNSNVLKCNVQLAYDRFFTSFHYPDNSSAVQGRYMDSNPDFMGVGANKKFGSNKSKETKNNTKPWWANIGFGIMPPGNPI